MPARMDRKSPKQFCGREDDEIGCGETKAVPERSFDKIDAFNCACHNFAKALNLAFGLKINDDSRVVRPPFFQAFDKLRAFCLGEHEIPGRKLADIAIFERAAEILRTGFNPALADLDLCIRSSFRFDVDPEMIWSDVIANESVLIVRCSEQKICRA